MANRTCTAWSGPEEPDTIRDLPHVVEQRCGYHVLEEKIAKLQEENAKLKRECSRLAAALSAAQVLPDF